ncbi:MAG: lipocalin family protein [Bacteroidetes bacterium]|nr:lipocalin family protein [Bacteroidota bacterium]
MKKIFLISIFILTVGCSSDSNSDTNSDETVSVVSDIAGQWKLSGIYANNSNSNIATECELLYGEFQFASTAVEKRGFSGSTCTDQTYTYSSYNIVDGQLRTTRNDVETRYYVKKNGNVLSLTKFYTKALNSEPIVVPTADQKTNKYSLQ